MGRRVELFPPRKGLSLLIKPIYSALPTTSFSIPASLRNADINSTDVFSSRCLSGLTGSPDDPESRGLLSVAIVGSGPSGMYTSKYLRSAILQRRGMGIDIDVIERLPNPYGLVRNGVAPDHPEVKNVENDFAALFEQAEYSNNKTASSIKFFGNVTVGRDVSLSELRALYDIVVLAYGCESDRKLGIEGEESLRGVLSAREFVAWYNGHPDFSHIGDEFADLMMHPETTQVVVIGQGNVALDCARILAKGRPGLFDTDIASHALPILQEGVKRTIVLGRRGHVQGAFTIKELRELTKLEGDGHDVSFLVREDELDMGTTQASLEELNAPGARPKIRIDKLLRNAALLKSGFQGLKEVVLRFLLNPIKFIPDQDDPTRVGSLVCDRTELKGEPGKQVAVGTGETENISADVVLVSIGYKGKPLPGMNSILFDEKRGIVKNHHGKVSGATLSEGGLYASGWIKRGPSGIIGTNIADAKDTVAMIMADLNNDEMNVNQRNANSEKRPRGRDGLLKLLDEREIRLVDWNGYQKIDTAEKDQDRRRSNAQPREKIVSVEEMINIAR